MPKPRPDITSRAGATLRGVAAFDPPPAAGYIPPSTAGGPEPGRFEDLHVRRTVYLRRDHLDELERRRRAPGGPSLAAQLEQSLSAYLT